MPRSPESFIPLRANWFHILLALAAEEQHGYGIMQEVGRQSAGRYKLGPGTLYDNLQRLMKQGLVEEVSSRVGDASRRRYYRLSSLGRAVLSAEVARLEGTLDAANVTLRSVEVPARKSDIAVGEVALVWTPWRKGADGFPAPAY